MRRTLSPSMTEEMSDDKTYRTRLLEFLCFEQKALEADRARIDARLHEIREHIAAITRAKTTGELGLHREYGRRRRRDDH